MTNTSRSLDSEIRRVAKWVGLRTIEQNKADLLGAYEGISLLYLRRKITREELNARIMVWSDLAVAAGLTSFEERDALANEAVRRMGEIIDVDSGVGGTWQ